MCSVVVMIPSEFSASQVTGPGEAEFLKKSLYSFMQCNIVYKYLLHCCIFINDIILFSLSFDLVWQSYLKMLGWKR